MFVATDRRGEAASRLAAALAEAGIDEARTDARLLVASALAIAPLALLTEPERPLGPDGAANLTGLARRRLSREPVGRILGCREFWGLPFRLSPGTLEPRPDSEAVVEAALRALPDRDAPVRVLDLGTGSGCLLVAILSERPAAFGLGIDRSLDALRTAQGNAAANGVGARAGFAASDWGAAVSGPFDLVVSNPPYIATGTLADLSPEVTRHDPAAALDGGSDGLVAYRALLPDLRRLLRPGGPAVLEIGHDGSDGVSGLVVRAGWPAPAVLRDLGGRDRALLLTAPH